MKNLELKQLRTGFKKDVYIKIPPYNEILAKKFVLNLLKNLIQYKDEISETNILKDDLSLDSLDLVQICLIIEKEFSVQIDDLEVDSWITVKSIIDTCSKFY